MSQGFPDGYFYILSQQHGYALDVYDGQTKEYANVIVWPQKFHDSDNQLWKYQDGRLINKKSGHALDTQSNTFKREKSIVQTMIDLSNRSQEWRFDNGTICSGESHSMVLDIKGGSKKDGAHVVLYKRKSSDNLNQLWYVEPYQAIQATLSFSAASQPLHKCADFGQPRPGYGAEVGFPPELKQVVPLGSTDHTQHAGASGEASYAYEGYQPPLPPSDHGSAGPSNPMAAHPPPAYPSSVTTGSAYPPPPPPPIRQDSVPSYPPPPATQNSYPPPPPAKQDAYSPPPVRQDSYPPPPASQDSYPPPHVRQDTYPPPPTPDQQSTYSSISSYSSRPSSVEAPYPAQAYPAAPSPSMPSGYSAPGYPTNQAGGFYPPPPREHFQFPSPPPASMSMPNPIDQGQAGPAKGSYQLPQPNVYPPQ